VFEKYPRASGYVVSISRFVCPRDFAVAKTRNVRAINKKCTEATRYVRKSVENGRPVFEVKTNFFTLEKIKSYGALFLAPSIIFSRYGTPRRYGLGALQHNVKSSRKFFYIFPFRNVETNCERVVYESHQRKSHTSLRTRKKGRYWNFGSILGFPPVACAGNICCTRWYVQNDSLWVVTRLKHSWLPTYCLELTVLWSQFFSSTNSILIRKQWVKTVAFETFERFSKYLRNVWDILNDSF